MLALLIRRNWKVQEWDGIQSYICTDLHENWSVSSNVIAHKHRHDNWKNKDENSYIFLFYSVTQDWS